MYQGLVGAKPVAQHCENYSPDSGSQGSIDAEPCQIHFCDARWQRNILPDHGNEAPDKSADVTMPFKKKISLVEHFRSNAEVSAVFKEKRPAKAERKPVIKKRSEKASENAAEEDKRERHLSLLGKIPCRRHDNLAGERKKGRFQKHEPRNPQVAQGAYGSHKPID